jgi:hypothetical protein
MLGKSKYLCALLNLIISSYINMYDILRATSELEFGIVQLLNGRGCCERLEIG